MRFKPAEIIALGGFIFTIFKAMKAPKQWYWWLLMAICGGFLIACLFFPDSDQSDNHAINATATGSGSSAQAAGHDINNGVPASTVQQILNLKQVELSQEMLAKYPHGCVLLGLENGKVVYDPRFTDIQIESDWQLCKISVDNINKRCQVSLPPSLVIREGKSTLVFRGGTLNFPYIANQPDRTGIGFGDNLVVEVLDADKGIFVIGLMPDEYLK